MALATRIPDNERRPGQLFIFRIGQGARGLTPLPGRVALVGAKASDGTQPVNQPVQVFSYSAASWAALSTIASGLLSVITPPPLLPGGAEPIEEPAPVHRSQV